ncbi:hypothetical protein BDZ89DRAFT_1067736 [Hymenopellis radicata]|nr:hypothetical protein BDZ89DRAFT_1067736 [Hymenopellis radicata]
MKASRRDSTSTVNCDPYILRLPNELLLLIFNAIKSQYRYTAKLALRRLAVVCRRFRDLLIPDLFRIVSLPKYSFHHRERSALCSFLPSYGHHIRHLEASPAGGADPLWASSVLSTLSLSAKHFTNLQYLQIHLHRTLTTEQQADLVEMFKVLPPHLQELDLAGFSWTSAAKALAVAQQPNLQRLSLNLESIPSAPMAPAKFTSYFPAIVHIHIPGHWCPQPSWFIEAFLGSKLEHIAVGFADRIENGETDSHLCSNHPCRWTDGLYHLFAASASSLTNLTISTPSFPSGSFVSFIERVTTVTFRHIDFNWSPDHLVQLVGPFATLSITSLRFDRCSGIPPTFARWFEDTEQSRRFFPTLKELQVGRLYALVEWEDFNDLDFGSENIWRPAVRREFEWSCKRRGIEAVFYWDFFMGWD